MRRQKLTDEDVNFMCDQMRMEGETEEFIAEEVERLKRLNGYEGRDGCRYESAYLRRRGMNELYDGHGRGSKSRLLEAYYLGLSPKPEAALTTLINGINDWVITWDEIAEFRELLAKAEEGEGE